MTLLGKAEWMNPGGSVKDRAAAAMVGKAIADGSLCKGKILLDATSQQHRDRIRDARRCSGVPGPARNAVERVAGYASEF